MMINRASDKNSAINKMIDAGDFSEENEAVMNKLTEERNEYLKQSIPYLNAAIAYIDKLDEDAKAQYRPNLYSCLKALSSSYIALDMLNEAKPVQERIKEIEKSN